MNYTVFFILVITLFSSCSTKQKHDSHSTTLKVDLTEQNVSLNELFSHIEVIPLETQDNCLIVEIEKVMLHQDLFYIFDQRKPAIYVFTKNGAFIKEIAGKGKGPGEYQAVTDMILDDARQNIILLSPFGSLFIYDMEGRFLQQQTLPIKPNYYAISSLQDNAFAVWSCVETEDAGISVIHTDSMKILHETWHNDRILDMGLMKPFYQYNAETYFSTAYQNTVYQIKSDSLEKAYQWDFGKDNIEPNHLLTYTEIKDAHEKNNKLLKDLEEGILPYAMERHNQNDSYYYVALRKGMGFNRPWINVFYRKQDGKSFVFEQTKEGIPIHPILFTNDFLVATLASEDINSYNKVLSEKEYEKLKSYSADDNPCLVKLYFK